MKKILVATDGSPHALKAAKMAGEIAQFQPDASVTIVYVAHVPRDPHTVTVYGVDFTPDVPLDAMIQKTAEPLLVETKKATGLPENRVTTEVLVGHPAEEICGLAHREGYDLVVTGSRGLSPIKEILLGSVSDRIAHCAHVPVLIVK